MTPEPIIKVENFNFYYGAFQALKEIHMTLSSNQLIALIGPSGCGKTTFLRSINRLSDLIPGARHEGKILLRGQDIHDATFDVFDLRRKVGMVFQKPNPFPMSIFENIAYGPRCHGLNDKKSLFELVERSLKKAALWDEVKDRLTRNALELSGGQQQRLCIARAIAMNPDIILLDEPTSALDPISTAKIEELLIGMKEQYTLMIVTHSMQQAARISDTTAFFLQGELIELGPTEQFFSNPEDKRTEDYITGRFG